MLNSFLRHDLYSFDHFSPHELSNFPSQGNNFYQITKQMNVFIYSEFVQYYDTCFTYEFISLIIYFISIIIIVWHKQGYSVMIVFYVLFFTVFVKLKRLNRYYFNFTKDIINWYWIFLCQGLVKLNLMLRFLMMIIGLLILNVMINLSGYLYYFLLVLFFSNWVNGWNVTYWQEIKNLKGVLKMIILPIHMVILISFIIIIKKEQIFCVGWVDDFCWLMLYYGFMYGSVDLYCIGHHLYFGKILLFRGGGYQNGDLNRNYFFEGLIIAFFRFFEFYLLYYGLILWNLFGFQRIFFV